MEQAPTMNALLPAAQCTALLTWAPLPLQGHTVNVPLTVQRTSVAAPYAHFRLLFAGIKVSTNHSAGVGFPAISACANVIPGSAGGASAYPECRYAANSKCATAYTERALL